MARLAASASSCPRSGSAGASRGARRRSCWPSLTRSTCSRSPSAPACRSTAPWPRSSRRSMGRCPMSSVARWPRSASARRGATRCATSSAHRSPGTHQLHRRDRPGRAARRADRQGAAGPVRAAAHRAPPARRGARRQGADQDALPARGLHLPVDVHRHPWAGRHPDRPQHVRRAPRAPTTCRARRDARDRLRQSTLTAAGGAPLWRARSRPIVAGAAARPDGSRALSSRATGCYLPGTNSIHMLFMRFPIDCRVRRRAAHRRHARDLVVRTLRPGWRPWIGSRRGGCAAHQRRGRAARRHRVTAAGLFSRGRRRQARAGAVLHVFLVGLRAAASRSRNEPARSPRSAHSERQQQPGERDVRQHASAMPRSARESAPRAAAATSTAAAGSGPTTGRGRQERGRRPAGSSGSGPTAAETAERRHQRHDVAQLAVAPQAVQNARRWRWHSPRTARSGQPHRAAQEQHR